MKKVKILLLSLFIVSVVISDSFAANIIADKSGKENKETKEYTVKDAIRDFKNLDRKEKKSRIKEVKKAVKEFKAAKREGRAAETDTVLLVILAILLPPLAVYLYYNEINTNFWISLILTLLFWIPGVIFALLVVLGAI